LTTILTVGEFDDDGGDGLRLRTTTVVTPMMLMVMMTSAVTFRDFVGYDDGRGAFMVTTVVTV
jgi:hypothetical protein